MLKFVNRRLFRVSLRTAFVAVTLLCIYLTWQLSIVRARQSLLQELRAKGYEITTADQYLQRYAPALPTPGAVKLPMARVYLGDEPIQEIRSPGSVAQTDRARIAQIIPEAEIGEIHYLPCHPGCFPAGTAVTTPDGRTLIEKIHAGDLVTTIGLKGEMEIAAVRSVFITDNRLWNISTEAGDLLTTQTQPLCLSPSKTVAAGDLEPGDEILRYDDGQCRAVKVLAVAPAGRCEKVHNLILGNSQIFIADGFLARSKPPARAIEFCGGILDR